jgi:hypothetical protein
MAPHAPTLPKGQFWDFTLRLTTPRPSDIISEEQATDDPMPCVAYRIGIVVATHRCRMNAKVRGRRALLLCPT